MRDKHIPVRMCVACRERESKHELIRMGEGRGAYVHDNSDCIVTALKKRSFNRALRGSMNFLNTIGLCKRAGKLITGFDAVVADISKCAGVLIACDLSEKTKKEVVFHCDKNKKPFVEIEVTMSEIEQILGKKTGIMAILDEGLFKTINKG